MQKLKLDLDQVRVDSFAVDAAAEARRGTVNGHSTTFNTIDIGGCAGTGADDSCGSCAPRICQPMPISWDNNC